MNIKTPKRRLLNAIGSTSVLLTIAMTVGCANLTMSTDISDDGAEAAMSHIVTPFVMFQGKNAQEAIDFYVDVIPDSKVEEIQLWGDANPAFADEIMFATVTIGGQKVRFSDSPIEHAFDITPSISFFVECATEEEIEELATKLQEGGAVLMPMDSYGFSEKFTWVVDRFGVSWQLIYGSDLI
ncbi:MAG: VOC family protein [Gammaproteobacteria bacterium]|nr:VOC family protein [Gammaproteobacteria bacterium]